MAQGEATGTLHVAWRGTWLQKSPCQKLVYSDPLYRSGGRHEAIGLSVEVLGTAFVCTLDGGTNAKPLVHSRGIGCFGRARFHRISPARTIVSTSRGDRTEC